MQASPAVVAAVAILLAPVVVEAAPTARFDDLGSPQKPAQSEPPPPPTPAAPVVGTAPRSARLESWATRASRELVRRADISHRRGQSGEALALLTEAVRMDPTFGPAYLALGRLRESLGDPAEAERVYGKATRLREGGADAFRARAELRHRDGRVRDALADLEAALAQRDTDLALLRLLTRWYVEQRAWPAALGTARRTLAQLERDASMREEDMVSARLQVRALTVLAAETDPVLFANSDGWVRRALASIARR